MVSGKRKLSTFQLLGYTWTEYESSALAEAHNCYGYTDDELLEIVYDGGMDRTRAADILHHERLHAINGTLRIGLTHQQIYATARGLAQLFLSLKQVKK